MEHGGRLTSLPEAMTAQVVPRVRDERGGLAPGCCGPERELEVLR
jgi:hypothetical protein